MGDFEDRRAAGARLRAEIDRLMGPRSFRSYRKLAEAAELEPNTLTGWWTKGYMPTSSSLLAVAKQLDVPYGRLQAAYEGREWSEPSGLSPEALAEIEAVVDRAMDRLAARIEDLLLVLGGGR